MAQRHGDRPAVTDGEGQSLSHAQLSLHAHQIAHALLQRGLQPGQAVGVWLPNSLDAVRCAYGIRMMGAAETPMSGSLTREEFDWCASLAQVKHVITTAERQALVRSMGLQAWQVADLVGGSSQALPDVPAWHVGRILFTSGTTGKPKGVIYTHGERWAGEQMLQDALPFVPQPSDRLLLMTPFVHGASLLTFAWCHFGARVLLHDGVDMNQVGPLLQSGGVQALFAPPTVLAKITKAMDGQRIQGIQCIFTGTQALTPTLYREACAIFGPVVRITYGKSECVNPITVLSPAQTHAYFEGGAISPGACVGWPVAGVEISVRQPTQGIEEMPLPQSPEQDTDPSAAHPPQALIEGEIFLRAPQMCSALITPEGLVGHTDGWHASGDLGWIDQAGRLILTGRLADVIKTGGYRVNPDEIETALAAGRTYGAICVTAIPSAYWGDIIIAVAQDTQAGWEDEIEQKAAVLSKHKRPRLFVSMPTLPRNAQGKISRKAVAQTVLQSHRLIDGPHPSWDAPGAD